MHVSPVCNYVGFVTITVNKVGKKWRKIWPSKSEVWGKTGQNLEHYQKANNFGRIGNP